MVVRSPCQENDPADAHPSAHKSVLESANRHGLGVCIWMHLVNGTGDSPSLGRPTPGVGAAKGKHSNTEALCQPIQCQGAVHEPAGLSLIAGVFYQVLPPRPATTDQRRRFTTSGSQLTTKICRSTTNCRRLHANR